MRTRMSSSRLPGKMLMPFGQGSLLTRVIRRATTLEVPVVVATSTCCDDDPIVLEAESRGVAVHRDALNDVLGRARSAAEAFDFDAIARLCGDRPFFPLDDMSRALDCVRRAGGPIPDLVTTHSPVPCPPGLTTEIVSTAALARSSRLATRTDQREHMTRFLYENMEDFECVELPTKMHILSDQRFAVDTEADYRRLSSVAAKKPDIALPPQAAAELLRKMKLGFSG